MRGFRRLPVALIALASLAVPFRAEAACPGKPALVSPAGGAQQKPPVKFEWSAAAGAELYRLVITRGTDFSLDRFVTETTVTLELEPGKYQWRVAALAKDCDPAPSDPRELTVTAPGCPDSAPKIGSPAIGERVKSPVTISWSPVANATRYGVVLFKDGAQVGERIVDATSVTVDLPAGRYDWVVGTVAQDCPVMRSPFGFFVISAAGEDCATEPPALISPAPLAAVTSPALLSWSAVRDATEYRVHLKAGSSETVKSTTDTKLSIDLAAGGYDWFVEAIAPSCPTLTSQTSFFRLVCNKGKPLLTAPANQATVKSPVEFAWSGSADATGYILTLQQDGHFFGEIQTTKTSQTLDLPPGDFEWWVMAGYSGCPGEESTHSTFKIAGTVCGTTAASLTSPAAGAAVTTIPVSFQWTAVPAAFAYQLLLGPADAPMHVVGETKDTSFAAPLPPDRYRWTVVALRDGCPPIDSTPQTFQVQASGSCTATAPALVSPAAGATAQPPINFSWNAVDKAVGYVVFLVRPDGTASPLGATESATTLTVDWLPAAKYSWFVSTLVPGCNVLESARSTFEVTLPSGCPNIRPFTLMPPDGAANVPVHVRFDWSPVPGATSYQVWTSTDLGKFTKTGSETAETSVVADVSPGRIAWIVVAQVTGCPGIKSEPSFFTAVAESTACGITIRPALAGGAAVLSGEKYTLRWSPVPGAASYEVQEDTSPLFTNPTSKKLSSITVDVQKSATSPTPYSYRVRPIDSCQQPGPFSLPIEVIVQPKPDPTGTKFALVADVSRLDKLTQEIDISGAATGASAELVAGTSGRRRAVRPSPPSSGPTFTATADVPWLTLTPSSGQVPASGKIQASIDPALLRAGTSRGTVTVTKSGLATGRASGTTGTTSVVSVSLVTPVTPTSSSAASSEAIIIPLVTKSSTTSSALAVTNLSSSPRKYELTFIPTDVDGTKNAKVTSVQVEPGETAMLEDVLASWFGATPGTTTEGSIEIRPTDTTTSTLTKGALTLASALGSSSSATTALQNFVSKIPLTDFVQSGGTQKLVLPDIRHSDVRSTLIGLLEAAGSTASAKVTVYNATNTIVAQKTVDLKAREETLLGDLLSGLTVDSGRAEVELASTGGKVTAFAQSTDARSSDEQIAPPLATGGTSAAKRVVPDAGSETDSSGRTTTTDLWIHNPSSAGVPVTLTLYPEGTPTQKAAVAFTVAAGETKLLQDVIAKSFQSDAKHGSVEIDAGTDTSLIVSATRTETGPGGTFSTPLTIVTSSDGIALNGQSLNILHGRESSEFETDLTLVELSGSTATVKIMAIVPDSKVTPSTTLTLQANEMKRVTSVLSSLGLTSAYNARIVVQVTSGSGRVWAEGSLLDLTTHDRSIIPAE